MKNLGTLFLLLLTAGMGAIVYQGNPKNFLSFSTPIAKVWLILLMTVAAGIAIKVGMWILHKYSKIRSKGELKQAMSVYKYTVIIILVFVGFGLLYGVIGPVITSIGLLAAGLTLALQKPILNIAGWFFVVTKQPYKIGDRIDIGIVSGYVHEIDLMHTHLSLLDKEEPTGKVVYIPNEQALTQPIVNYMKGSPMVWDGIKVKMPASADPDDVESRIKECVEAIVGKEMKEAAQKWKADVKPETRTALEYNGLVPYYEITVRYLSNAKTLTSTKTQITKQVISKFKKELKGS